MTLAIQPQAGKSRAGGLCEFGVFCRIAAPRGASPDAGPPGTPIAHINGAVGLSIVATRSPAELSMTMRWLTQSVGVSLPLLLLFAALQARAPRSPGPDVAEAAPAVGKPVSAGTLPATISSPRGSQRATEGRPALVALRSHPPVLGPISSDFGAPRSFWLNRPHTG